MAEWGHRRRDWFSPKGWHTGRKSTEEGTEAQRGGRETNRAETEEGKGNQSRAPWSSEQSSEAKNRKERPGTEDTGKTQRKEQRRLRHRPQDLGNRAGGTERLGGQAQGKHRRRTESFP
jgi:hypothetical protein